MNDLGDNVVFCKNCLSLAIVIDEDSGCDVCSKCKCTIIEKASIEEWEKKYKEKYPKERVLHPRGIINIEELKFNNKYYD